MGQFSLPIKGQFNATDTAAMVTQSPRKPQPIKPQDLAALPDLTRKKPIILPPKPANTGFPDNNDPYWKAHPLETQHNDGTIREWGEQLHNPNLLPKQMLPPPSNPDKLEPSDKAKGFSNNYYSSRDQQKTKAVPTTKSNMQ